MDLQRRELSITYTRDGIFSRRFSKEWKDSITGEVAGNNALCKQRSLDENACLSFFPLPPLSRYTLHIYIYTHTRAHRYIRVSRKTVENGENLNFLRVQSRNNEEDYSPCMLKSWVKSIGGADGKWARFLVA